MENDVKAEKKNNGLVIALVVIIVALLGVVCYFVVDKVKSENKDGEEKKTKKIVTTVTEEIVRVEKVTMTPEERYSVYITGLASSIKSSYNRQKDNLSYNDVSLYYSYDNNTKRTSINFTINEKLELIMWRETTLYSDNPEIYKPLDEKEEKVKVADNVVGIFEISEGSKQLSPVTVIYFIKTDGNVYRMTSKSVSEPFTSKKFDIDNIQKMDLKNITHIYNAFFEDGFSGWWGPVFVDIDGNIHSYEKAGMSNTR